MWIQEPFILETGTRYFAPAWGDRVAIHVWVGGILSKSKGVKDRMGGDHSYLLASDALKESDQLERPT